EYRLQSVRTGICAPPGRYHHPVHDRRVSRELLPGFRLRYCTRDEGSGRSHFSALAEREAVAPETSSLAWHDATPRYAALLTSRGTGPAHFRCSAARAASQRDTARRGDDYVHQRNDRLP